MHNSYNGSRSTTYWSEHNRVRILIVHHSIANVTDKHQHIPTQNHTIAHTLPRPRHSLPWTHHNWRTCICNSHCQSSTWQLDRSLLSISKIYLKKHPWYILITNTNTHKHTRAQTHRRAHVTAALITSHLTDPHLQFKLTKFDITLG